MIVFRRDFIEDDIMTPHRFEQGQRLNLDVYVKLIFAGTFCFFPLLAWNRFLWF